ncbi:MULTISPECIES: DUF1302 domain-containing protein [unclassified Pseudomonas]|uniref:DUF1302 domain-containing protein n=1 Tax=unclassified Pseudomonas TaxID=196821 RepID=UPI000C885590|nr:MULTISPECIES: DUF1302 domain-containing protein [unclassified Pseudomonas]PMZ85096.1 DUF1302 domain-containing protein [Pseudomonas sp. FW215-T2]PNA05948.1 DUF1302 domain-containing protein [Pseudomonas sp. FW215-R3]PNB33042.1 DUF1302 domain-containing protein [Pseudomonas sp. FW305-131]
MIKTIIAPPTQHPRVQLALLLLAGGLSAHVNAMSFQPSEDLSIDWDTTLTYSLAWRTESRDHKLTANANGNDGDNAFDKGSLINNRSGFLTEANIKWQDNYGVFVRATGFYDNVYDQDNDNTTGTSNCFAGGHCSKPDRFSQDTVDQHRNELRMLDYYAYGTWDVSGHALNARLGNQVVSWGESLFYPGISAAQSPVDATKATTPGVEVKEILLPVGQLFTQFALTESLGIQAYYQYKWEKTELFGVGSYFSTTDFIDEGGFNDASGFVTRLKDDKPSDSGQYGVAFTYAAESLNNTEFGLFYSRYHDKTPSLDFATNLGRYQVRYFDNIDLFGASFATVLGDVSWAGEVSYRDGTPVMVDNGFSSPVRGKTIQAQTSMIYVLGPTSFADNTSLTGELVYNTVVSNDESQPVTLAPGFALPGTDSLVYDRDAWGYTVQANLDYNDVFSGWDMSVPVTFSAAVHGDSSMVGSINAGQNDNRASIGSSWRYLGNFTVEARYNAYLGSANNSPLADRDNVALNFKYRF